MIFLLAGLFGLGIFLLFFGAARVLGTPTQVQVRLQQYGTRPRTLEEIELSQPFSERIIRPIIRGISRTLSRVTPQRNVEEMRHKLDMAGNPNNWTTADFLGVRGLAALLTAVILVGLIYLIRGGPELILLMIGIGGFLGFYLPMIWLNMRIRARQSEVQKALPDALDLLTISVEAGLGFDAAMAKVAQKWDNELSRAFARVNAEIRVGKLRREALRDMANRLGVPDVSNFIAAVIQADQLGVSIAKVLRIQSEQIRIKRRQVAEKKAHEAPVKMMFPLAFLIFPAILITLLGPAVLTFLKGGLGLG